jgi:hypothetical protein
MVSGDELDTAKKAEVFSQIPPLDATLISLDEQLRILREEQANLKIVSPLSGIVTSWDVAKKLNRRPVKTGQALLEVADPKGDWELEVMMPEDRIGHISRAAKDHEQPLRVTYFLATDPGTEHEGEIQEIHEAAEVRGEDGNTVLVRVRIKQGDIPEYSRPGSGVTAKIYCGRHSIGYVWFHDLIAFVQSRILFRL